MGRCSLDIVSPPGVGIRDVSVTLPPASFLIPSFLGRTTGGGVEGGRATLKKRDVLQRAKDEVVVPLRHQFQTAHSR